MIRQSSRSALMAVSAALGVVLVAAAVAPAATAQPGCQEGPWGARVQGVPPFRPGDAGGVYLWHDIGFHLRVTHRYDNERVYAGTITSPTPMHLSPVALEANDRLDLSPDGRTISFAFANYGHDDGANFTTDCADHLVVGPLTVDTVLLPPERIYLGANEIRPEHNPATIHRNDQ